jgi:hypothetical protein
MKVKLTLGIDPELVQFAHEQSKSSGRSVSYMVSDFLHNLQKQMTQENIPSVASMVGSLKNYKIDDSKSARRRF